MKERKFDFYLSAFVSSARAITWVMKSEYGKVPGWKAWYDARKAAPDEARLLKGTNALRTRLTKQEALRTTARIQLGGVKLSKSEYDRINSVLLSVHEGAYQFDSAAVTVSIGWRLKSRARNSYVQRPKCISIEG
jgi:hypothetical protein